MNVGPLIQVDNLGKATNPLTIGTSVDIDQQDVSPQIQKETYGF